MPNNQRVEDQAFGRTARQGKRGTGQMILNLTSLVNYGITEISAKEVKQQRDRVECTSLEHFQKTELKLILAKDKLFKKFCDFLNNQIRMDIRKKSGLWKNLVGVFAYQTPTVYEHNVLTAIEEQWAMFLYKLEDKKISIETSEDELKKLLDKLLNEYNKGI